MTAQIGEQLIYKGEEISMSSEPLWAYLSPLQEKFTFNAPNTACWRGYYGKWEIKNDKLYLVDFLGYIGDDWTEVGMEYIFPSEKEVFANWFTGELRIQQGELLEYIHMGYGSDYEEDLFLEIKDGCFVGSRVVDNRDRVKARLVKQEMEDQMRREQKEKEERKREKRKMFWRKIFGARFLE